MQAIVLSPSHLKWEEGSARITSFFAAANPAALVRFFPAEWLPNLRPGSSWEPWFCGGRTPMSNPGHAILIQSKRFPLVWKELRTPLPTWHSLLPDTKVPSEISLGSQHWVLKPVFGRVGEDVGDCRSHTTTCVRGNCQGREASSKRLDRATAVQHAATRNPQRHSLPLLGDFHLGWPRSWSVWSDRGEAVDRPGCAGYCSINRSKGAWTK